jgi:RNA polymerase sigma-70 factor (ECF subfamily)
MNEDAFNQHLSEITTQWTKVLKAAQGPDSSDPTASTLAAQRELLQQYGGAVSRYLLRMVHDPEVAADLAQDFALLFLVGKFRRVRPEQGRFRDYVKTVLINLVRHYYKQKKMQPRSLPHEDAGDLPVTPAQEELDREFLSSWREELLTRTWEALSQLQQQTGQAFYVVLRYRTEHPELNSEQMADQLFALLGKPFSSTSFRKMLHRARAKFADLLLAEVEHSLSDSSPERLAQELSDLDLLPYCRSALERRQRSR